MATEHETFGDVIRLVVGERTLREVGKVADVSHTYISDWQGDKRPTLRTLLKAANAWEAKGWLRRDLRARLFQAAGYVDPLEQGRNATPTTLEPVLDHVDVRAFRKGRDLPEEDAAELNGTVEWLIDQRRKRLGYD